MTVLLGAGEARAQFNVQWVGFRTRARGGSMPRPGLGLTDPEEKDYAWGDVDNDGDIDLVVVRKQPGTTAGKKPNVLFMNEDGALVDRTAQYASETDVPGDLGFLTPTNDRDVVLADFNGDGWLDIATGVTISDGFPKPISHPRIYVNKGAVGGASGWGSGSSRRARRSSTSCSPTASPNLAKPQPGPLLLHRGGRRRRRRGHRPPPGRLRRRGPPGSDSTTGSGSTTATASSATPTSTRMNAQHDGLRLRRRRRHRRHERRRHQRRGDARSPGSASIAYNKPPDPVPFDLFHTPHVMATYFVSVGDLNNDDKLDMVMSEDGEDRYLLNQGNDALGRVIWSPRPRLHLPRGRGLRRRRVRQPVPDRRPRQGRLEGRPHLRRGRGHPRLLAAHAHLPQPRRDPGRDVTLREEAQQAGAGSGLEGRGGTHAARPRAPTTWPRSTSTTTATRTSWWAAATAPPST